MKGLLVLCAASMLAACDDARGASYRLSSDGAAMLSSTPVLSARVSPQTLPIVTVPTVSCAVVPAFTTAFDLIIAQLPDTTFFVDRVTFRLNDGSSLGGPAITIPRLELNSMFGSTVVTGTRAFAFRPTFGCGTRPARLLVVDVTLVSRGGSVQHVSTTARF